jgi:hypothetical protein
MVEEVRSSAEALRRQNEDLEQRLKVRWEMSMRGGGALG